MGIEIIPNFLRNFCLSLGVVPAFPQEVQDGAAESFVSITTLHTLHSKS